MIWCDEWRWWWCIGVYDICLHEGTGFSHTGLVIRCEVGIRKWNVGLQRVLVLRMNSSICNLDHLFLSFSLPIWKQQVFSKLKVHPNSQSKFLCRVFGCQITCNLILPTYMLSSFIFNSSMPNPSVYKSMCEHTQTQQEHASPPPNKIFPPSSPNFPLFPSPNSHSILVLYILYSSLIDSTPLHTIPFLKLESKLESHSWKFFLLALF